MHAQSSKNGAHTMRSSAQSSSVAHGTSGLKHAPQPGPVGGPFGSQVSPLAQSDCIVHSVWFFGHGSTSGQYALPGSMPPSLSPPDDPLSSSRMPEPPSSPVTAPSS